MAAVQPSQASMQQTGAGQPQGATMNNVLPPGMSKEQLQAMYKVCQCTVLKPLHTCDD
jgi:ATP-dependent helicase STH1/SNF2